MFIDRLPFAVQDLQHFWPIPNIITIPNGKLTDAKMVMKKLHGLW